MALKYSPRAGNFTEILLFQSPVYNASNDEIVSWVTAFQAWGDVNPIQGREFVQSGRDVSEEDVLITTYDRDDILPNMTVLWRKLRYDVRRIDPPKAGPRTLAIELLARLIR